MNIKPQCPSEYCTPNRLQSVYYLVYALCLTFIPCLIIQILFNSVASNWIASLCSIPLWIMSGYGFFMLAGTAHEGFHFNLHPRPITSAVIGIFFSSAIPGFMAVGFYSSHWMHHRFTNTQQDPDFLLFGRFKSFWSRAFLARLSATSIYRRIALDIARGLPLENIRKGTFTYSEFQKLSILNFATQGFWFGIYIAITLFFWKFVFLGLLISLVATILITGLNPYQEHGDTGIAIENCARTRISKIYTVLMFGTNYHFEHHLYPRVPCWRLPRLHRWLKQTSWYRSHAMITEKSFVRSFVPAISRNIPASAKGSMTRM